MSIKVNLYLAYDNAMKRNPDASRKESFSYFLTEMQRDPQYLVKLAEYYFDHQFATYRPETIEGNTTLTATPAKLRQLEKARITREEGVKSRAQGLEAAKIKMRAIILMDLTLPNGKKLRDATGAECAKAGGFYTAVSKHLKGTQVVGKQLEESELRNILSRFDRPGQRRTIAASGHEMRV